MIGKKIIHLEETHSTNTYARELISSNKQAEGIIVLANYQTAGKGQGHNKWMSEKDANLLMSAIVKPAFLVPEQQFFLNISVCLAIVRSIEELYMTRAIIKWPNDILVNDRKVAGVLIENSLGKNTINNSIIGIGLNVNQENFDPSLPMATSLLLETGINCPLDKVFDLLLGNLRIYYQHLKGNRLETLKKMYENLMYGIKKSTVLSVKNGDQIECVITGITDHGELLVESGGSVVRFGHDQVRIKL